MSSLTKALDEARTDSEPEEDDDDGKAQAEAARAKARAKKRNVDRSKTGSGSENPSGPAAQGMPPNMGQTQNTNPVMGTGMMGQQPPGVTSQPSKARFAVDGTNIGSRASEPEWTMDQLQAIAVACDTKLKVVQLADTRRSWGDPKGEFVRINPDTGAAMAMSRAILPNLKPNMYSLGLGKVKPDQKTGKARVYSDAVIKGPDWVLNQWTIKNVILEGVPDKVLDKPPRMINGKMERRIGHEFARIGLPKESVGPVFGTLRSMMPSVLEDISHTRGYYWVNASWGVHQIPAKFVYVSDGVKHEEASLYRAMKMLNELSSMGAGTVAISIANTAEVKNGDLVSAGDKYELSVKIHNMFHMKKVPYHSPPQSAATGFEVTEDMFKDVEELAPVSNMTTLLNSTSAAFGNQAPNPFFNMQAPTSTNVNAGPDKYLV